MSKDLINWPSYSVENPVSIKFDNSLSGLIIIGSCFISARISTCDVTDERTLVSGHLPTSAYAASSSSDEEIRDLISKKEL